MKYLVVGNCQARIVSKIFKALNSKLVELEPVIVQLSKLSDKVNILKKYEEAELISCQLVNPTFPLEFLRTNYIKESYPEKAVSWPSIFFSGFCPDLVYVTSPEKGRILSPLSAYNSKHIFRSWRKGISVNECEKMSYDTEYWRESLNYNLEESYRRLREREKLVDISVTDIIEELSLKERTFFTFNHPSSGVLLRLVEKVVDFKGIKIDNHLTSELLGQPLSIVIPPIFDGLSHILKLNYETSSSCKGYNIFFEKDKVKLKESRIINLQDLIELSYKCFDVQLRKDEKIRFTPSYK